MKLIDHRTKETIYEAETATMRKLVEEAVAERKELHYADLYSANLIEANLEYANLCYANLLCADLSHANTRYASLSSADMSDASLRYANLRYANLSCTNLTSAALPYADLSYANLANANLSYANLSYANLRHANLVAADLSCTTLSNANLFGGDLRYVKLAENVTVKATTWRTYTAISSIGSRNDTLHLFNTDAGTYVKTGCFSGTVDEFMAAVKATHGKTRYAQDYAAAIDFAKQYFKE